MLEEGFIRAEQKKFLRVAATSEGILRLLKTWMNILHVFILMQRVL